MRKIVEVAKLQLWKCVGVSCAAVAMGVIQAKYSTYILVLQLYITSMQTAVSLSSTLFKI